MKSLSFKKGTSIARHVYRIGQVRGKPIRVTTNLELGLVCIGTTEKMKALKFPNIPAMLVGVLQMLLAIFTSVASSSRH